MSLSGTTVHRCRQSSYGMPTIGFGRVLNMHVLARNDERSIARENVKQFKGCASCLVECSSAYGVSLNRCVFGFRTRQQPGDTSPRDGARSHRAKQGHGKASRARHVEARSLGEEVHRRTGDGKVRKTLFRDNLTTHSTTNVLVRHDTLLQAVPRGS